MSPAVAIRVAEPADVELIQALIVELATYEQAPERARATPELLERWLFGAHPAAEVLIAELEGEPAGFALFHGTFSTWEGRPGIWLEDLFVREPARRAGIGGTLLRRVAALALERGCARLEWTVLTWNEPALRFYETLGAEVMEEWRTHRLDRETMARVAGGAA